MLARVACSTVSTHHREPNQVWSAASQISSQSPAAATRAHLPILEPTRRAVSLHAILAATAIAPAANPPPDRAANTPPPSAAAGQRRQFPSRPLPFPKPAWSETAGCPNRGTHTQIPAAHESPAAPPDRSPHTLESSSPFFFGVRRHSLRFCGVRQAAGGSIHLSLPLQLLVIPNQRLLLVRDLLFLLCPITDY